MVIVFFQSQKVSRRTHAACAFDADARNGAAPASEMEMTRAATPSGHSGDRVGAWTNQWADWWRGGAWGEGIRYWRR